MNNIINDNNNDVNKLKSKNKELQEQINTIKNEFEEYKNKNNTGGSEGGIDIKSYEELK